MSVAAKGLRIRPRYEELIGVAVSGKLYDIKFFNRDAKFLRGLCSFANRWGRGGDNGKTARNCK